MSRLHPDLGFCLHFKKDQKQGEKMLNHIKNLLRTGKEEIFWVQILHARTVLDTLQQKKDFHKMTYKQMGTTTKKWPLHHDTQKRLHYPPWKHSTVTNTHTNMYFHNIKLSFVTCHSHSIFSFILDHTFHHLLMYMNVLYQARWWQQ